MREQKSMISFLHKVPLFQRLTNQQLEKLERRLVERTYSAGQSIVTQGQGGEGFFIILSGEAEAYRQNLDGSWLVVNTFAPTDYFGEMALLDDGLRTASVIASESTQCLVLTRWDFLVVLREGGVEMAIVLLQELASRFRHTLDGS
jgi:CRP-like cAMP-binding protein